MTTIATARTGLTSQERLRVRALPKSTSSARTLRRFRGTSIHHASTTESAIAAMGPLTIEQWLAGPLTIEQ